MTKCEHDLSRMRRRLHTLHNGLMDKNYLFAPCWREVFNLNARRHDINYNATRTTLIELIMEDYHDTQLIPLWLFNVSIFIVYNTTAQPKIKIKLQFVIILHQRRDDESMVIANKLILHKPSSAILDYTPN